MPPSRQAAPAICAYHRNHRRSDLHLSKISTYSELDDFKQESGPSASIESHCFDLQSGSLMFSRALSLNHAPHISSHRIRGIIVNLSVALESVIYAQDVFPGKYVVKAQIGKVPINACRLSVEANGLLIGSFTVKNPHSSSAQPDAWLWRECILASYTLGGTMSTDVKVRIFNVDSTLKAGLAIESLKLQRVFYHTQGPYNEL